MREITRIAGWTFASLAGVGWVAGVASMAAVECTNDCPPSPIPGAWLFVFVTVTVALASSLLAHGYGPAGKPPRSSTSAALAAKIGKLLALGPVTLMLASPLLAMFHPVVALVSTLVFGLLASAMLGSARSLDRLVTPERFTTGQSWAIAIAVLVAAGAVTYAAA